MLGSRADFWQEKANGKLSKGKDGIPRLVQGEDYIRRIYVLHMRFCSEI